MKKYSFGQIVYHKNLGSGVFLGNSSDIFKTTSKLDSAEIVLEGNFIASTVDIKDLSDKPEPIKFIDCVESVFTFEYHEGGLSVYENDALSFELVVEDVTDFIDCLRKFEDFYGDK